MDVNNNAEASREIEFANRLLREREADHSRELDGLRRAQKEQVDDLSAKHSDSLKQVHDKTSKELENARANFDDATRATTDTYEKRLSGERAEAYDRYGRLAADTARDRAKAQDLKNRDITDLITFNETQKQNIDDVHKRSMSNAERSYYADKQDVVDVFSKKLDAKDQAMQDAIRREQQMSGENLREARNKGATMGNHDLQAYESKYKKLLEDSMTTEERMMRQSSARDQQMKADSALNAQHQRQGSEATLEEYRERASEALNGTISKGNAERNELMRANEAAASQATQDRAIERQRLKNEFHSATSALEAKNELDKSRAELRDSLTANRHKQDMYLTEKALNESSQLNSDEVRARYIENLKGIEETNRRNFEKRDAEIQNRAFATEASYNAEKNDSDLTNHAEMQHKLVEAQRARANLIRAYDARQRGIEEMTEGQRNEAAKAALNDVRAIREESNKEISASNREKTAATYQGQLNLRNRTDELEAVRNFDLNDAESRYMNHTKRLNENYNRNLMANKDAFDEEAATYKYETAMQILKSRGDAEHEKRIALLDLLQKNRAQMTSMESKFNETRDEHDAELIKMKQDNDKSLRETMRRARETIEVERTMHGREIEARDMATKEKLKLQEEAFKDQIEKIKRTYDLSSKKS